MKICISVSPEKEEEVIACLTAHGLETGEDGEYLLTENSRYPEFLSARDGNRERIRLAAEEVVYIEAFGKDVEIHTGKDTYFAQDRMYQLEASLDPAKFLRVSKSVIVSAAHVRKIRPSLSMKYILTLSDGTLVDVTRSYYSDFRRFFGI